MNRNFGLLIIVLVAVMGTACSKNSSDTEPAVETSSASQVPPAPDVTSQPADAPVEVALVSDTGAPTYENQSSAEAYASLMEWVRTIQQSARSQKDLLDSVSKIESALVGFIDTFPGTYEANDCNFQLGILYGSMMQAHQSIKYLTAFLDNVGDGEFEKSGYAHFYRAESYKNADEFSKAKAEYELFVRDYASLNAQFTAAAQSGMADLETLKKLAIGSEPLPFEATDADGKTVTPAKLKGKVVLLDFWATWCGPCRVDMPDVVKLHKKYKKEGFEIIGISLDSDKSRFLSYVKSNDMDWPHYFDGRGWQNEIASLYKVRSIPATFLLDREGKIRYRAIRGRDLEKAVEKLLKET